MYLRRLEIRSLPGIEPGFVFEPASPGVNVVTGPNAVGKSSLVRALGYLLASARSDPRALSLEAEFLSGDECWQVRRNGSQIQWLRNREVASRPVLPAADQIGRYRLSIDNLLHDGDASDRELAEQLRRELHGNFDLAALRGGVRPRFARHEARALDEARRARRGVANEYEALRRREAELPALERQVDEAREARRRGEHLEQALALADAVDTRKRREAALAHFPSGMDRLRGDELQRIERIEEKRRELRDERREQQRRQAHAQAALEGTGLASSIPSSEAMQAVTAKLRTLDGLCAERRNAAEQGARAKAELNDALAHFNEAGTPPRLDAEAFRRAEAFVPALVAARTRRRELSERHSLAGETPEDSAIEGQRDGAEALRAWLAAHAAAAAPGRGPARWETIASGIALAAAAVAAVVAFLQGAFVALAAALVALVALVAFAVARWARRASGAAPRIPKDEAERRFRETGIEAPAQWEEGSVRRHLREHVEARLNALLLQRQRAEGADRIALELAQTEAEIETLESERAGLAAEYGFDPCLPLLEFDRFVHRCAAWDQARKRYEGQSAALDACEREIDRAARLVHDALSPWEADAAPDAAPQVDGAGDSVGSPRRAGSSEVDAAPDVDGSGEPADVDRLHGAFEALKARIEVANAARGDIRNCETALESLDRQTADTEEEAQGIFVQAGLAAGNRAELGRRLEALEEWKEAKRALERARTEEDLIRSKLSEHPELAARADGEGGAALRSERDDLAARADAYTALVEERTEIQTRLEDAGKTLALEGAAAEEHRAQQALADKREEALLAAATKTLLDDVERAFVAEHEPAVLRRAREIFAQVTAHAFDLQLHPGGRFVARDLRQGTTRTLGELSSGTRAQLLLALRLAWTEAQEEGGEALPLFLDEALTTSDEDRFAVMARSLERIAGAEGRPRQVFYLSARRHENALWQRATGTRPATVDLAALRFHRPASAPEDYRIEEVLPIPAPEGHSAETYAALLGVPALDPQRPEGEIHVFHLLRDELSLLHSLMDTWRVLSQGQLEALLASDAAPAALPEAPLRRRMRRRCRALRAWVARWRQGRGRPVDRGALERSGAVSAVFIERVTDLAGQVRGDGEALVRALRGGRLKYFYHNKLDELEEWLRDEGYIDRRERLDCAERRRLTLLGAAPETPDDAADINRMLNGWEAAAAGGA